MTTDTTLTTPLPPTAAAPSVQAGITTPAWTLLCVDDEPNILSSLRRLFRGAGYRIMMAADAEEALEVMQQSPVDLVLSDMRMPGMNGAQLLEQVRQRWPDTVRLLLTGHADMASTIAAINRGEIYRYITKPWNDDDLLLTVQQAFERRGLEAEKRRLEALTAQQNEALRQLNASLETQVAQRTAELQRANGSLNRSYLSAIKAFANLTELRGEQMRGHARRVADLARRTATHLGLAKDDIQNIFIAGLLHDVGQLGLTDEMLEMPVTRMSPAQRVTYERHPVLAEQALMPVEDVQPVAQLIRHHHERFDGQGYPDGLAGTHIPLGARILSVADVCDDLQNGHLGRAQVTAEEAHMLLARGRGEQFCPEVLDAFFDMLKRSAGKAPAGPQATRQVLVDALQPGMVLAGELRSAEGVLMLAAGQVLTDDLIRRLQRHARSDKVKLLLQIQG